MDYLEITDAQGRRRLVALDRPHLILGREPACDVLLPDPDVARRHAQLQLTETGRWLLQDLSNLQTLSFNDRPIQQIVLEPKKPVRIADYWLTLLADDAEAGSEVEQWGALPGEGERPSLEAVWLEQLQIFQRSLRFLEDTRGLLESLAREFRRVLRPRVLAVGRYHGDDYLWDIVLSDQNPDSLQKALDQADQQRLRNSGTLQSWVSLPGVGLKPQAPADPNASLLIPIKGRRQSLGHIYVTGSSVNPVPTSTRRYLGLAAAVAGLALENIELAELQKNQVAMEQELQDARAIQLGLFPETLQLDPRLEAFGVNLPSTKVSGDYYDLIRTGPDTVAFVIADAMGHGMAAALMMASVRAALRMGLTLHLPWPSIFQGLDELIRAARGETFVTGLVGQINLATRELTLVSAGHPAPSVLVNGAPVTVPSQCWTRPWGLDLETNWEVGQVPLTGERWSILCYTDGITDNSTALKTQGAQRLAHFHQQYNHHSAEDLCQTLLNALAGQTRAQTLPDDQTLLVMCSKGR